MCDFGVEMYKQPYTDAVRLDKWLVINSDKLRRIFSICLKGILSICICHPNEPIFKMYFYGYCASLSVLCKTYIFAERSSSISSIKHIRRLDPSRHRFITCRNSLVRVLLPLGCFLICARGNVSTRTFFISRESKKKRNGGSLNSGQRPSP